MYRHRHPLVASSLQQVARVRFERGDYDTAERLHREVLESRRRIHGNRHPEVARSLHELASVLSRKGEYDAAEAFFREALAIDRLAYGADHLDVAADLNSLGLLLWRRADYAQAEAAHREALEVRRKHLGADHPDVLTSLFNLATVREELGDPEAERLYREVLERRRRIYRGAHPFLATTLENLAGTLSRRGELPEAAVYFHEALALRRELLGSRHPEVAKRCGIWGSRSARSRAGCPRKRRRSRTSRCDAARLGGGSAPAGPRNASRATRLPSPRFSAGHLRAPQSAAPPNRPWHESG